MQMSHPPTRLNRKERKGRKVRLRPMKTYTLNQSLRPHSYAAFALLAVQQQTRRFATPTLGNPTIGDTR
jgi:hypothetical protein